MPVSHKLSVIRPQIGVYYPNKARNVRLATKVIFASFGIPKLPGNGHLPYSSGAAIRAAQERPLSAQTVA